MWAKQPKARAFTLVELMVSMAIIAVLMGLAAFGISIALRVSRDDQRRSKLRDISTALNAYYADNGAYPTSYTLNPTQFVINASLTVPLTGVTRAGTATNATTSRYCIDLTVSSGFAVGIELEGGGTFALGTATTPTCTVYATPT